MSALQTLIRPIQIFGLSVLADLWALNNLIDVSMCHSFLERVQLDPERRMRIIRVSPPERGPIVLCCW